MEPDNYIKVYSKVNPRPRKQIKTSRDALVACIALWKWLARNPDSRKDDWPGWDRLDRCASGCPCCQYVKNEAFSRYPAVGWNADCSVGGLTYALSLCPLKSLWPKGCMDLSSPFFAWAEFNYSRQPYEARIKASLQIVEAAKKLLKQQPKVKA
jgi:hypothetical protein